MFTATTTSLTKLHEIKILSDDLKKVGNTIDDVHSKGATWLQDELGCDNLTLIDWRGRVCAKKTFLEHQDAEVNKAKALRIELNSKGQKLKWAKIDYDLWPEFLALYFKQFEYPEKMLQPCLNSRRTVKLM